MDKWRKKMIKIIRKINNALGGTRFYAVHHVCNEEPKVSSCIISEEGFCKFLENKKIVSVKKGLRRLKSTNYVITVDDGLDDTYTYIYQKMKQLKLPFTIFVSADLVGKPGYITKEQLIEMANDSLVTIGSHGCSHVSLKECKEEFLEYEIIESKQKLEKIIQRKVEYFAYPFGDYNKQAKKMVKRAGYKFAFGVKPRKCNFIIKQIFRFDLPRYNLTNATKI